MKKIFFALLVIPSFCLSQQNLQSVLKVKDEKKDGVTETIVKKEKIPVVSIFGVANLNQETLKGFNAGGKASVGVRPLIINKNDSVIKALAIYASFNKSASNNDSVVHSKLIFPELGSSSFIGTVQWERYCFKASGNSHSAALFFELGLKSIQTDSSDKGQKLFFDALNYTLGFKYGFNYVRDNPFESGKKLNLGFYAAPFISAYNIPDEDRDDYKKIMMKNATIIGNGDDLSDFVISLGLKLGFHLNGIEFFSDLRHVLGKSTVPIRELKGFHANIGFVFNADVLNFY